MKKIYKALICLGLCGSMAFAGCSGASTIASQNADTETRPFKLAIGAVDRKFNPLFYTSANDGVIASQTQISLLTADANGELAYGNDYATVTLDYKETYYSDANGTVETENTSDAAANGSTQYEMLLKNGIKFSDGSDLTVMDVLFNLYVYLDPIYSGSATMYSTKIVGLQAYRQQDPTADSSTTSNTSKYRTAAYQRYEAVLNWANGKGTLTDGINNEDVQLVLKLFKEELESDWNGMTGWEETYEDYNFTSAWQAFYFMEGVISVQTEKNSNGATVKRFNDANGNGTKDDGEKYYTAFDEGADESDARLAEDLIEEMEEATSTAKVNAYMEANPGVSEENAILALQGECAVNHIYDANCDTRSGIKTILTTYSTSSTFYDELILDETSKDRPTGALTVPSISGITVRKLSAGETFNGKTYTEDHDILSIRIEKVDPKAKWNFSFAVTPMKYYSDEKHYTAAMEDYNTGKVYKGDATNFGVSYKDNDWFNNELGASDKTSLPMGAGAYMCTHYKLNNASSSDLSELDGGTFFYNNVANYERNPYFYTVFGASESEKDEYNAKIKYITYQVTSDDKIVESLTTGTIDYGTPTATADNLKAVNTGNLRLTTYRTGGYGYIGINPKYVPDIELRKAIMYSFDTSSIVDYYGEDLVTLINMPISLTSWASPENPNSLNYDSSITRVYETTNEVLGGKSKVEFLTDLIKSKGNYYYQNGVMYDKDTDEQVKITFTIAGESTDHPSYKMMTYSAQLLEQCGLDITVETDVQALQKLATGDLAVWAAAWQSSIDPDPYQIYSIYSNASSTKNWYKDGILNNQSDFEYEYEIAEELAELIDDGRSTLNQTDRANIYKKCLQLIMDLAVEFPTYQRNDLCVYDASLLDENTMHIADASYNMGPIDEIWKVNYRSE